MVTEQERFDRLVERAVETFRAEIMELGRLLTEAAVREDEEMEHWAECCSPSCRKCILAIARDDVGERWNWNRSRSAEAARVAALQFAMEQLHADSVHARAAVAPWGSQGPLGA